MKAMLDKIYYDPRNPAGYGGATKLKQVVQGKVKTKVVDDYLKAQIAYTLHKPIRKRIPRNHYLVSNIDDLFQSDLCDVRSLKQYNGGYTFLLTVIDALSKFAWVEPLRDKTNTSIIEAFTRIFKTSGRKPENLQTDKGTEFTGEKFQRFLKREGIHFYTSKNPDIKARLIERFHRTLKEKIWRYFTHKNTHRYIDILQYLVDGYNNSIHSTIKMRPKDVDIFNAGIARANMKSKFSQQTKPKKLPKLHIGDSVRITKNKGTFDKGYETNWSEEVFKIIRVVTHRNPHVYVLEDLAGEEIDGTFYEQELQAVVNDEKTVYRIDKIIRSRGKGGSKEVFVKWKGYPDKFNSWIPANSLK